MATGADSLRVLEWDKVQEQLARLAYTPDGRSQLERLLPFPHYDDQMVALAFAGECLDLMERGDSLPLRPVGDLEPLLLRAAPAGAQMEGAELALAGDFCQLCTELANFWKKLPEQNVHLREQLQLVSAAPEFARAVARALEPDGTVRDNASPQLAKLKRIRQRLERDLLATLEKTALTVSADSVVTVREGRYVVSVPERHRTLVPGIVHDRSQSGATYFIEPLAVMDQGNHLRAAEADIRDEIASILRGLTAQLHAILPRLRENLRVIGELDVVWAKARWAARLGGRIPQRTPEPLLQLRSARHPLLLDQVIGARKTLEEAQQQVVPFPLSLGPGSRSLIISGPNTGGKTVCLKAVGLVTLLAQTGVPAPVSADSCVGNFDAVFADIGDDQSLALSLSTFSAHLKHVGDACRHATGRSLVLLDELGVGTDPEEGGALAQSVLEALLERDATVVVTTHHPALKLLHADGKVMHAAFAFHEANFEPTYELVTGRPGRSYALEVAGRLGFPPDVVARAGRLVSQESRDLAKLLDRLSAQERELSATQARLSAKENELDGILTFNRGEEERWRKLHDHAQAEARSQASALLTETRREVERLVKEIRSTRAHPEAIKRAHRDLESLADRTREAERSTGTAELEPGDRVRIIDLGVDGEIVRISTDGRRVSVRIGQVTHTVAPNRLARASDVERAAKTSPVPSGSAAAPDEIDVRGLSVEEALFEVDGALQAVASGGGTTLRVIHGMGTGVLRREISVWLRRHGRVASLRRGEPGEGSEGVTVVTIKP